MGTFVYHCHIMEHSDRGMMSMISVLPAPRTDVPTVVPSSSSAVPSVAPSVSPVVSSAVPSVAPTVSPTPRTSKRSFFVSSLNFNASDSNPGTSAALPWKSVLQVGGLRILTSFRRL